MSDDRQVVLQLPRFTRSMKTIAAVLGAIWLVEVLVSVIPLAGAPPGALGWFERLALVPAAVVERHHYWRLLTHALLHDPRGVAGVIFTALGLWFFGGELEQRWGLKRLAAMWAAATVVGALVVVVGGQLYARWWVEMVVSPIAASSAMVMAWCAMHLDDKLSFFGLAELKGRHFAVISLGIALLALAFQRSSTDLASLGGFAVGWVFAYFDRLRPQPRKRTVSSPQLRVIRGGASKSTDLPN